MATYIISYDLSAPSRNYDDIHEAIRSYGTWAHITESTWAVVTDQSATEVRDYLGSVMDNDDKLFVVLSAGVGAWRNIRPRTAWLKKNL